MDTTPDPVPAAAPGPRPRGSWQLLADPVFGPYVIGKITSSAGLWIYYIVVAILVFDATGSALWVGVVGSLQFVPQLLLSGASGASADRGHLIGQIVGGRLMVGAGGGGLGVWVLLFHGENASADLIALIVASIVVGLGFTMGGPAMLALVPALVRHTELAAALTLNSTVPMTLARMLGPTLGALAVTSLSPAAALFIAGGINLGYGVLISLLPLTVPQPAAKNADLSVRGAVAYLRRDPVITRLLLVVAAVGIGNEPSLALAPSLAAAHDGGATLVGWIGSGFGAGAAVGLALIPAAARLLTLERTTAGGLLLVGVGLALSGINPSPGFTVVVMGLAGIGMSLSFTGCTTLLQERTPSYLRGRIMAFWLVAFVGIRPLSVLLNGWIADVVSVGAALYLTAALILGTAYVSRPTRLRPLPPPA